jgi:hypothetical protein
MTLHDCKVRGKQLAQQAKEDVVIWPVYNGYKFDVKSKRPTKFIQTIAYVPETIAPIYKKKAKAEAESEDSTTSLE